jgi:hypothetical protein
VLKRVPSLTGEVSPTEGEAGLRKREGRARRDELPAPSDGRRRERGHATGVSDRSEAALLAGFRALPILQPPPEASAPPGSGLERAQAAAMAERLLHSVRVGKVDGAHEVRLGIAGSRVEVRLRQDGERLLPELHLADGASAADARVAERLATRLDTELRSAGLDFDPIAIRR